MSKLCWLKVSIGGVPCAEDIVLRLYDDKTPKTCANFRALCEGNGGKTVEGTDVPMTYKNSIFHRVIPKFMLQAGDFTNHNGTGGVSIYGEKFADENFEVACDRPGLLAMANAGPNTNGSQFFITTVPCHHLTGKHVVFGHVVRGMATVRKIEHSPTGVQDRPVAEVKIVDCGSIDEADLPAPVPAEDGDDYPEYIEDSETPLDDEAKLAAGEAIRKVGNAYFMKAEFLKATEKYAKALRYLEEVLDTSAVHQSLVDKKVACNSNMAMCFIKLAKWAECKQAASAALALDSGNAKALFRRGCAYLETKDYEEARGDFKAVLAAEPGNADAAAKLQEVQAKEAAQQARMAAGFKKMFA